MSQKRRGGEPDALGERIDLLSKNHCLTLKKVLGKNKVSDEHLETFKDPLSFWDEFGALPPSLLAPFVFPKT